MFFPHKAEEHIQHVFAAILKVLPHALWGSLLIVARPVAKRQVSQHHGRVWGGGRGEERWGCEEVRGRGCCDTG